MRKEDIQAFMPRKRPRLTSGSTKLEARSSTQRACNEERTIPIQGAQMVNEEVKTVEQGEQEPKTKSETVPSERARHKRLEARVRADQRRKESRAIAELRKKHHLPMHDAQIVDVPFKSELVSDIIHTIISFALEYLMFVRGQVPSMVSELRQSAESMTSGEGVRVRGDALRQQRRANRLIQTLDRHDRSVGKILETSSIDAALFIFGQSLASPLEVYLIRFRPSHKSNNDDNMDSGVSEVVRLSEHQRGLVQKKVARQFVQQTRIHRECPQTRVLSLLHCHQGAPVNTPSDLAIRPDFLLKDLKIRGNACPVHVLDCRTNRDEAFSLKANSFASLCEELDSLPGSWLNFLPRIAFV